MRAPLIAVFVSLLVLPLAAQDVFKDAKLTIQEGDKSHVVDVSLRYDPAALVLLNGKKQPVKTLPYTGVKSAEYSYATSPRWKTAIFISPLALFSSGKKHWLMLQGESDFAVLQLDKGNYRVIVAELEAKLGRKVEVVGEK